MAEGSIWEAFDKASYYKLDNLIGILDMNRLGQRGETDLGWNSAAYAARARAFGWHAIEMDGHDLGGHRPRLRRSAGSSKDQPTCLVAKTEKGHGVSLPGEQGRLARQGARRRAGEEGHRRAGRRAPSHRARPPSRRRRQPAAPAAGAAAEAADLRGRQQGGDAQGVRRRAGRPGRAPARRGRAGRRGLQLHPRRRVQEGLSRTASSRCSSPSSSWSARPSAWRAGQEGRSPRPSPPSSPAPTTRSAWRRSPTPRIHLCGSHAGVSIGEDGPSQMALEDLAMMRAVYGSTVLYPCDANQTAHLVERRWRTCTASRYLRTTREKTPVLYPPGRDVPGRRQQGGEAVRRRPGRRSSPPASRVHEALKAYDAAARPRASPSASSTPTRSSRSTRRRCTRPRAETGGKLVVVEDHWPEGGLGDAVLEAFTGKRRRRADA